MMRPRSWRSPRYRTASGSERDQDSTLIHTRIYPLLEIRRDSAACALIPLATARGSVSLWRYLIEFLCRIRRNCHAQEARATRTLLLLRFPLVGKALGVKFTRQLSVLHH